MIKSFLNKIIDIFTNSLKWYHIIFLVFIIISILFYLFFSYPNSLILNILFSFGRVITISLFSLFLSLIIGTFLANIYIFTPIKIIKPLLKSIFLIPNYLYGILLIIYFSPINTQKFIIIISIILSYSFFEVIIKKIEELNNKKFMIHLQAINLSNFKIFKNHILPFITLPLLVTLVDSVIFVVNFEFIISIINIVTIFENSPSIGTIAFNGIKNSNYSIIITTLVLFSGFMIGLNYLTYKIKNNL